MFTINLHIKTKVCDIRDELTKRYPDVCSLAYSPYGLVMSWVRKEPHQATAFHTELIAIIKKHDCDFCHEHNCEFSISICDEDGLIIKKDVDRPAKDHEVRYWTTVSHMMFEKWTDTFGQLHRVDSPADREYDYEGRLEFECYCINGKLHRVGGPARIWYDKEGNVRQHEFWEHGVIQMNILAECKKSRQ